MPHAITRRHLLAASAAALAAPAVRTAHAADAAVQLISHRYPGLEYYAEKLKSALPGVAVDTRLMQAPDAIQLQRLALSSGSTQLDILWANSITLASYAKSGWLEPLDDLWAKHKDEFNLGDYNQGSVAGCSYDGHIYGMPLTTNTMLYAYRSDLYDEKGLKPATTWDDYVANAKALNSPPRRYGVVLALKSDMVNNEMHSAMNTVGDGWFDKDWRPTFNDDRGVKAVETIKRLAQYCGARLHRRAQRRAHREHEPGHRGAGPAMGDALRDDGQSGQVARRRQDQMDGDARGRQTGDDQRHLLHLALHRQGQGHAVPPAGQRAARGEPAWRRRADDATAQRGAERSGAAGEIPLVSGGVAMPRSGEAAASAARNSPRRRRSSTSASCRRSSGRWRPRRRSTRRRPRSRRCWQQRGYYK